MTEFPTGVTGLGLLLHRGPAVLSVVSVTFVFLPDLPSLWSTGHMPADSWECSQTPKPKLTQNVRKSNGILVTQLYISQL